MSFLCAGLSKYAQKTSSHNEFITNKFPFSHLAFQYLSMAKSSFRYPQGLSKLYLQFIEQLSWSWSEKCNIIWSRM